MLSGVVSHFYLCPINFFSSCYYGLSSKQYLLVYNLSASAFSLPVSTTILDLTILEFNL
jgi:hypothetical protein